MSTYSVVRQYLDSVVKIQRWVRCVHQRVQNRSLLALLSHASMDTLHDFLQDTLEVAHQYDHVLLTMLRDKYLTYCLQCAQEDISVSTYKVLLQAVSLCGMSTDPSVQTNFELKHMLESWQKEVSEPGFLQRKRDLQQKSTLIQNAVRNGKDGAFIQQMVEKGVFDVGCYPLTRYSKLRVQGINKRRETTTLLTRMLFSKRFSITGKHFRTNSSSELSVVASCDGGEVVAPSPSKRKSSALEEEQQLLPFTLPGADEDPHAFKTLSTQFWTLLQDCRARNKEAEFLDMYNSSWGFASPSLRTEVIYQTLMDLSSKDIRNESDDGEFVLVKYALNGSEHVLAILATLLTLCELPYDFGPYVVAWIVQHFGKYEDSVSQHLLGLIRFENKTPTHVNTSNDDFVPMELKDMQELIDTYSVLMPDKPKMMVRKRVQDAIMQVTTSATSSKEQPQPIMQFDTANEEEKEESSSEEFFPPTVRMNSEERELRENYTICQIMFDFKGEGKQYLTVQKGEVLWLSGLNGSKEWAKVYRREDQREGWVPLSFIGYPGYE